MSNKELDQNIKSTKIEMQNGKIFKFYRSWKIQR